MSTNHTNINFTDPSKVSGLTSAKGDIISGDALSGLTATSIGVNGAVLTADSAMASGIKWAPASGSGDTYNSVIITTNRSFPDMVNEGVVTLGALGATRMWVTVWGAGGGGSGFNFSQVGGGGSGGAIVLLPIDPNSTNLSAEQLSIILGIGGPGGVANFTAGSDGTATTVTSTDTNTTISMSAYGGGGGTAIFPSSGGGGGTGGNAIGTTGGIANITPSGGAVGPSHGDAIDSQDVSGYWWTGVHGGTGGSPVGTRGSHFFSKGRGGALSSQAGGGGGGYNGDGGDAGNPPGDAASNSGAGGGGSAATTINGGDGGSGGVEIEWI